MPVSDAHIPMARTLLIILSLLLFAALAISAPLRCTREGQPCSMINNATACCAGLECYESTACIKTVYQ